MQTGSSPTAGNRLPDYPVKHRQQSVISNLTRPAWTFTKVNMMSTKLWMAVAAASLIALTGCGTNPTKAQIGTATGAVIGGAAGSALGGGTLGTVGGAAAGALIGHEIGKTQDQKR